MAIIAWKMVVLSALLLLPGSAALKVDTRGGNWWDWLTSCFDKPTNLQSMIAKSKALNSAAEPEYTKAQLIKALELTSKELKKGEKVKIQVLGGAIGVLKHESRPKTGDIDAVVVEPEKFKDSLKKAAVKVTKAKKSPVAGDEHWLNFDASAYCTLPEQRKVALKFTHMFWKSKNGRIELWEPDWFYSLAQKVDKFLGKGKKPKDSKDGIAHLAEIIKKEKKDVHEISDIVLRLLREQKAAVCKSPKQIQKSIEDWYKKAK